MDTESKESTILRIHYGRLGHSDDAKTTLYGHITLDNLLRQSDKLTDTLSKEVHHLVNDLLNQVGYADYSIWSKSYETGFQVGLGIGFECGKI